MKRSTDFPIEINSDKKHERIIEILLDSGTIRQKIEQVRSAYDVTDEVNAWLELSVISD